MMLFASPAAIRPPALATWLEFEACRLRSLHAVRSVLARTGHHAFAIAMDADIARVQSLLFSTRSPVVARA